MGFVSKPTVLRNCTGISQRQQHVQHGHSIRQLVQAMNVIMHNSQQLRHHATKNRDKK